MTSLAIAFPPYFSRFLLPLRKIYHRRQGPTEDHEAEERDTAQNCRQLTRRTLILSNNASNHQLTLLYPLHVSSTKTIDYEKKAFMYKIHPTFQLSPTTTRIHATKSSLRSIQSTHAYAPFNDTLPTTQLTLL